MKYPGTNIANWVTEGQDKKNHLKAIKLAKKHQEWEKDKKIFHIKHSSPRCVILKYKSKN